jgi:hypothetical protein
VDEVVRAVCLMCGHVVRDDGRSSDPVNFIMSSDGGIRRRVGAYTNSSKRYTDDSLTDGLTHTIGSHDDPGNRALGPR